MNHTLHTITAALLALVFTTTPAAAIVDDARSFAIEAALPYLEPKEGSAEKPFAIRDAWWNGDSKVKEPKIFRHQLFKRNEYWFWAAASEMDATVSIAIYDEGGKLVEAADKFTKDHTAGVKIVPGSTGTYYIRVVIESARGDSGHWAVVYGYR